MIRFACPGCGATYSVPDAKAGKTGKCQKCQGQFIIPAAEAVTNSPSVSNDTIEIAPCPGCQARLSVSPSDLGLNVECPYCKATYTAVKAGSSPTTQDALGRKKDRPASLSEALSGGNTSASDRKKQQPEPEETAERPSRRPRDEDEDDDRSTRRNRERRSRGGMVRLRQIGVLSAARICGLIYAIIGLIIGVLYGGLVILFSLLGATLSAGGAGLNIVGGMAVGIGGGLCMMVLLPVVYGVVGFIGGAIGAAVYNLAASKVGGIECVLD